VPPGVLAQQNAAGDEGWDDWWNTGSPIVVGAIRKYYYIALTLPCGNK